MASLSAASLKTYKQFQSHRLMVSFETCLSRHSLNLLQGKPLSLHTTTYQLFRTPSPPEYFTLVEHMTSVLGSVTVCIFSSISIITPVNMRWQPDLDSSITWICENPYNPDEQEPMHFCPRADCRKWYHGNCLKKRRNVILKKNGFISETSPDKRAQESLGTPQAHVHDIPPELLHLACEPIIRGQAHGVVGNVKAVCKAREWAQLYAVTPLESRSGLVLNGITLDRLTSGSTALKESR